MALASLCSAQINHSVQFNSKVMTYKLGLARRQGGLGTRLHPMLLGLTLDSFAETQRSCTEACMASGVDLQWPCFQTDIHCNQCALYSSNISDESHWEPRLLILVSGFCFQTAITSNGPH